MELFARCTIADHGIACFWGTNFIEVTRGEQPKKVLIPGESVEALAAAAGPDILWLALTGDTTRPCVWYDPAQDAWHELDLADHRRRFGSMTVLPCILTGETGLPVWWLATGYEAPGTTLVIGLSDPLSIPEVFPLPGLFISARMVDGQPLVRTSAGEQRLAGGITR
ncbi:MAG TPA: hypothetical protein PLM00_05620 [Spirochaetota bacterium]|nr:hypothetical protein [Spirochaetota bacterium]HPH02409.1 hypothetical protein [Spirochaetota bacterium]HPN82850.1 hypothetical protein [Spirochaetota bacterium]